MDGKFQIIQHGDTFKDNRLADSRTGYVNIGEARSLPQAEKMVGDATEAMGTRPGRAAVAEGTGTGGSIVGVDSYQTELRKVCLVKEEKRGEREN